MAVSYDAISRFAQQGGAIYFGLLFVGVLIYALWPRNKGRFDRAAQIPFDEEH
jgi:cytochrome c oxidase cbb3-type subunit 4